MAQRETVFITSHFRPEYADSRNYRLKGCFPEEGMCIAGDFGLKLIPTQTQCRTICLKCDIPYDHNKEEVLCVECLARKKISPLCVIITKLFMAIRIDEEKPSDFKVSWWMKCPICEGFSSLKKDFNMPCPCIASIFDEFKGNLIRCVLDELLRHWESQ